MLVIIDNRCRCYQIAEQASLLPRSPNHVGLGNLTSVPLAKIRRLNELEWKKEVGGGTIENSLTNTKKRLPLSFRLTGGMKMAIKIGRMREWTKICKTIFLIRDVFRLLRCESCATFSCRLASSRPLHSTSTGLFWLFQFLLLICCL